MSTPRLPFVRPAALAGRHFSTLIVGAGINGVGVFRDLSLQGVDCLIVDKGDFGAGASSAPSRMIHGGLRYLEHGAFALVAEATRERNLLLRNAPHLVRPLKTVVPLSNRFGGALGSLLRFAGISAPPRQRGAFVVGLGLRLYDLLGRRQRVMPGHRIERVPQRDSSLFRATVRWTATFFDAWISHPEWLILELIGDACGDQPRSTASNYCRMLGCEGRTITLLDEITGESVQITADSIVNASGAWLDRATAAMGGAGSRVMGTKGSHLVLDHPALRQALEGRMAYFEAEDGRVCIVYPFLGRILVGSTDIPVDDPDQIATDPAEIDYLLGVLRHVFPQLSFQRRDVLYTYVGVRPLARAEADRPGQISREHAVAVEPASATRAVPLVSLVGGKWTTFRALSEQATDVVLARLNRPRTGSTMRLAIGGGAELPPNTAALEQLLDRIAADARISHRRAGDLVARYGSKATALAQRFAADDDDLPLRHAPGYSVAELRYLCLETGVVHLTDLVMRRTLLAIRGQVTDALLSEVAAVAAAALGWDDTTRRRELQACAATLRDHHSVPLAPAAAELVSGFEASFDTPSDFQPDPDVIPSASDALRLDRSSESPLWSQFRDDLRSRILQGELAIGAKLPSEAELGEQFGISRIVVREALADLVRNGLIYKIKGRGAFVAARERDEDFVSTVLGFSDEMERKGRSVRTQVLTQELRMPDAQEAASLGLRSEEQVVALKRLRSVDGELRLLVDTVVPAELAPGLHRARLEDRSLYDVMRRQYGMRIVRAERWIDSVLPDDATRALLGIEQPEALLRIESIAYGANGRAVEHYLALHRCQSSRLHVQTKT